MNHMFYGCKNLDKPLDISTLELDTSNVTDMSYAFCSSYIDGETLNNLDTSKVTDMSYMFAYSSHDIIDASNFSM